METMFGDGDRLVALSLALMLALLLVIAWSVLRPHLRASRRFGYGSLRDYLGAAPASDAEKRDAVDLAMKGVVLCLLGLLFAPLILIGLVPLFFGARKMAYASLGLGLIDDPRSRDG